MNSGDENLGRSGRLPDCVYPLSHFRIWFQLANVWPHQISAFGLQLARPEVISQAPSRSA
jgi:hypothetical protein